ncbi:aldolase [Halobacteriales archaeon QS_8_69_26]|nr:MAG: aldolase [Halobacteriales archaeon QS_8_69_26]
MDEFRQDLRAGEPAVGNWVSIGHPAVAEIAGSVGADFVTIDTEHAAVGIETVETLVRAVDAADGESTPVVRVPSSDPVRIKRVLDTGVGGIMVPRVDSAAEAEEVVAATKYPPGGIRGTAAGRAVDYGQSFAEYLERADDSIARILQVETENAVAEAGDIAAVDGVDALFVGPADLSAALDVHLDYDDEGFRSAVRSVTAAADDRDTPVGVFVTDPDRVEDWLSLGFSFAIVGFDAKFLVEGNRRLQSAFRGAVEGE